MGRVPAAHALTSTVVATATVGTDQRRLRRSSTIAGVGDGVVAVALPLLAANLTHDPLAVAAVVAAQHLPWALVHVGWRFLNGDRRTLIGTVDTSRALWIGVGLAVACLVTAGLLRHSWAYSVGWAIQVAAIALGLEVTAMFALGAIFLALWITAVRLGRLIDRDRAAAGSSRPAA